MPSMNEGMATATDSNGTKLTARIVEYDSDENKICEVIVIKGKLEGPGFIWDSEGRLLHKTTFKSGKPIGASTIKTYDENGTESYTRKLWWDDTGSIKQEQVYRYGKILWATQFENGKMYILKRWTDVRLKQALDKDGGDIKTPKRGMKCVELIESGRSYNKMKMEVKNIFGLPKELDTGFAVLKEVTEVGKQYDKGVDPPTYKEIKEKANDTPWALALMAKISQLGVGDKDSPYQKEVDEESENMGEGGMPGGGP